MHLKHFLLALIVCASNIICGTTYPTLSDACKNHDKKKSEGELKMGTQAEVAREKTKFDKRWLLCQARNIALRIGFDVVGFPQGAVHRYIGIKSSKIVLENHEYDRNEAAHYVDPRLSRLLPVSNSDIPLSEDDIRIQKELLQTKRRYDRLGIDKRNKNNERLHFFEKNLLENYQACVDEDKLNLNHTMQQEQNAYFQRSDWMSYLLYVVCEQLATDIICTKTCDMIREKTDCDAYMFYNSLYTGTQSVIASAILKQKLMSAREFGSYVATDAVYGGGKKLVEHATGKKLSSLKLPFPQWCRDHDLDERIVVWAIETSARIVIKSTFDKMLNVDNSRTPLFSLGIPELPPLPDNVDDERA